MNNKILNIPSNWKWVTLDDIGIVVSGGTPSTKEPEFWNGDIPWVTPADLSNYNEVYISKGRRNISKVGLEYSSATLLPENSIIFSSRAPIGYVAITKNELATNQGFKNLITFEDCINPKFVYYYLSSIKELANEMASGTTFLELSGTKFKQLPFPLAPIEEQNRIVDKIEELFSELDKSERELIDSIKKIKLQKKQLLVNEIKRKLSNNNFSDFINKIELLENKSIVRRNVPDVENNLNRKTPEYYFYELLRKGIIIDIKDGNLGESHPKRKDFSKKGMPFLTANLFNDDYNIEYGNSLKLEESFYKNIKIGFTIKNDVILTHKGTIGKTAINLMDSICSPQTTYYRLNREFILPKFLMYYFSSSLFQSQLNAVKEQTTRDFVSISKQYKLKTVLFPIEIQEEIINNIENSFTEVQKTVFEIEKSLKNIYLFRNKILKMALQGGLSQQYISDSSTELLLLEISKLKEEYIKNQIEVKKNKPKFIKMAKEKLSIIEVLKKYNEPISAENLWQESEHEKIDDFYEKLKEVEHLVIQDISKRPVKISLK